MESANHADINRAVFVVDGPAHIQRNLRLSDLATFPRVVILGEPGIGKTHALKKLAIDAKSSVVEVLDFTASPPSADEVFLDALDEYMVYEQNLLELSRTLKTISRWRISCRTESWRPAFVTKALRTPAKDQIVVVKLLPLDVFEQIALLEHYRCLEPPEFLRHAGQAGVSTLTKSPLSLYLLHRIVTATGAWPRSKRDLFHSAVKQLGSEHNYFHQETRRFSVDECLSKASRLLLLMLVTGHGTVSRFESSNSEEHAARSITLSQCGLSKDELDGVLGTALFQGDGKHFTPAHRVVAEYLGGHALALAVKGSGDHYRCPLSRATGLITGDDGKSPNDLRGLYAWFAVHLAEIGLHAQALELVRADPEAVLLYGDAAVFDNHARELLIQALGEQDPLFARLPDVSVSGLVGPDIEPYILQKLKAPSSSAHTIYVLLLAIPRSEPLPSLSAECKRIVLDWRYDPRLRCLAVDAWGHCARATCEEYRGFFNALELSPHLGCQAVRVQLLAALGSKQVTTADVDSILAILHVFVEQGAIVQLVLDSLASVLVQQGLGGRVFNDRYCSPAPVDRLFIESVGTLLLKDPAATVDFVMQIVTLIDVSRDARNEQVFTRALKHWLMKAKDHEDKLFEQCVLGFKDNYDISERLRLLNVTATPQRLNWVLENKGGDAQGGFKNAAILCMQLVIGSNDKQLVRHVETLLTPRKAEVEGIFEILATARADDDLEDDAFTLPPWSIGVPIPEDMKKRMEEIQIACAYAIRYCMRASESDSKLNVMLLELVCRTPQLPLGSLMYTAAALLHAEQTGFADMPVLSLSTYASAIEGSAAVMEEERRERVILLCLDQLLIAADAGVALLDQLMNCSDSVVNLVFDCIAKQDRPSPAMTETIRRHALSCPDLPPYALVPLLRAMARHLSRRECVEITETHLSSPNLGATTTFLWACFGMLAAPGRFHTPIAFSMETADRNALYECVTRADFFRDFFSAAPKVEVPLVKCLIEGLGRHAQHHPETMDEGSFVLSRLIADLGSPLDEAAIEALDDLCAMEHLGAWRTLLQHERANSQRGMRAMQYKHVDVQSFDNVLGGCGPISVRDLRALLVELLLQHNKEMDSSEKSTWQQYWDYPKGTDTQKRTGSPKIENHCRDHLVIRLCDWLRAFGNIKATSEVQLNAQVRADVLVRDEKGHVVPIEIKRHDHKQLLTAPLSQLAFYTRTQGANGYGIYLVYWFGKALKTYNGVKASSAAELSDQLKQIVLSHGLDKIEVVVIDVSKRGRDV
ncbi:hypothetical protein [Pantoea sp. Cy-639]|uniref:hypothetical protein n=1 Tax=Pantoea sp. Cy-639 TaxID=2608360 RepID=UPI001420E95E|nr:hypothetical protein [Pantoea sp. Cy-639]NIF18241.1 hypothetical protein [Pantoea sp. Cy-639]